MSIGQESQINPLRTPERRTITVVVHECPLEEPTVILVVPASRVGGRHRAPEPSVWHVADRVVGSWPITLRVAFLFLVLITGTAVLAAAVGVVGQLLLAGFALRARRRDRRRMAELLAEE